MTTAQSTSIYLTEAFTYLSFELKFGVGKTFFDVPT